MYNPHSPNGYVQPKLSFDQMIQSHMKICEELEVLYKFRIEGAKIEMEQGSDEVRRYEAIYTDMETHPNYNPNYKTQVGNHLNQLRTHIEHLNRQLHDCRKELLARGFDEIVELSRFVQVDVRALMNQWKIEQKQAHYAPECYHIQLEQKLNQIEQQFDKFGETLNRVNVVLGNFEHDLLACQELLPKLAEIRQQLDATVTAFLIESLVIVRQHPSVLVKQKVLQSNRKELGVHDSKRKIVVTLRLLGKWLGEPEQMDFSTPVKADLISEDDAKMLKRSPHAAIPKRATLQYNPTMFKKEQGQIICEFNPPLRLTKLEREQRDVPKQRWYLMFSINIAVLNKKIRLNSYKLSLPLGIITHGAKQHSETDAYIFWYLAMSQQMLPEDMIDGNVADAVQWPYAAHCLNMKFMQYIGGFDYIDPQPMSNNALNHLASKLFQIQQQSYEGYRFTVDKFFMEIGPDQNGVRFTFRDWFYDVMDTIKRHLMPYWNEGLIEGFMNKDAATHAVRLSGAAMVVRFSDSLRATLMITHSSPELTEEDFASDKNHLKLKAEDMTSSTTFKWSNIWALPDLRHVQYVFSSSRQLQAKAFLEEVARNTEAASPPNSTQTIYGGYGKFIKNVLSTDERAIDFPEIDDQDLLAFLNTYEFPDMDTTPPSPRSSTSSQHL